MLNLLASRLGNVTDDARRAISSSMNNILVLIRRTLSSRDEAVIPAALKAMESIALTLSQGEENSLTSCIPATLDLIRERTLAALALPALVPVSYVACFSSI